MIKEAYCSNEISKLLREKGFDEPCFYYYKDGVLMFSPFLKGRNSSQTDTYSAPTHQMAMAWLRDEYNIHITALPYITVEGCFWLSEVYTYNDVMYDKLPLTTMVCKTYEEAIEKGISKTLKNIKLS